MSKRECGGCTQCCKLLAVPELNKPQDKWCTYCTIGAGCQLQGSSLRPQACSDFNCLWLQGFGPERWRPDKTKVVMGATKNGELCIYVDPSRPNAWREPEYQKIIDTLVDDGLRVFIVCGDKRTLITKGATP